MDLVQNSPRVYQAHRQNQRERILSAAEELFIRDGIDRVTLADIARAARLTRKTLYEYFPNKQEIAWAILSGIFAEGRVAQAAAAGENGFQRLAAVMERMVQRVTTQPERFRFLVEFNTLYARESSPERMRAVTGRGEAEANDPLAGFIRQGITDGSICPSLDPELAAAAAWNLLSGMNSRFALLGSLISGEYGLPAVDIYQEICRVFLRGIQSTPSPQEKPE